jgi:putative spermidine/putrescine transport system permease protein
MRAGSSMFYTRSKSVRTLFIVGMLAPAVLFVAGTFFSGFLLSVIQSLGYYPLIEQWQVSLDTYRALLTSTLFYRSLLFSISVSLVATIVSAAAAVGIALWLRQYIHHSRMLYVVLQFNLPIPHIVGALALLMLLGQTGWISRLGAAAGWLEQPSQFPVLIRDQYGIGIILEYVWKEIPFIAISILSVLKSWVIPYEKQITMLGANRWQRFRFVTLPSMMPPLLAASIIVFAFTFGSFEVPYLIGSISQPTLPVLAFERYLSPDLTYRSEAMTLNVIITLISFGLIGLYMKWGGTHAPQR